MTRVAATIFIGVLAISLALGEDVITQMRNELEDAGKWIEYEASAAKSTYNGAVSQFGNFHHDIVQKVDRLNSLHDRALDIVENAPPQCQNNIKQNLMILKSGSVGNFFTCSKLLEAGKDVFYIGMTVGDLLSDVIDIGRDMTLGFSNCLTSFWPWRIVECWYDRITTTYDDIKNLKADLGHFISNITIYAHNASELIDYCWNQNSAKSDVVHLMTPLHQCAKQPVPHHIYEL